MTTPVKGEAVITLRRVEADQRFAFVAENIDPQPWRWEVHAENYYEGGYAAFRWSALLFARYWAFSFNRRERIRRRTREKAQLQKDTRDKEGTDE